MAEKHPYVSGPGGLVQAINQLRSAFPPEVTADTLKKLGIAPNNETYIINILRFIGVIDEKGKRTQQGASAFSKHDDAEFHPALSALLQASYKELFQLHGQNAWGLPTAKLISYFRGTDQTSAIVGQRQASTFQTLAKLSGHGEPVKVAAPTAKKNGGTTAKAKTKTPASAKQPPPGGAGGGDSHLQTGQSVGLTVRIEINLPANGDQETYDTIFKSIRANLLGG